MSWLEALIAMLLSITGAGTATEGADRVDPPEATTPTTEFIDPWPDVPNTPTDDQWDRMAKCESGGDWSINTGNGFYGGLQFTLTSWRYVQGSGYPHQASRDEQIFRADLLWLIQGWGAWPGCSRKLGYR